MGRPRAPATARLSSSSGRRSRAGFCPGLQSGATCCAASPAISRILPSRAEFWPSLPLKPRRLRPIHPAMTTDRGIVAGSIESAPLGTAVELGDFFLQLVIERAASSVWFEPVADGAIRVSVELGGDVVGVTHLDPDLA